MKKAIFIISLLFSILFCNAQETEKAEILVSDGIALHDKGEYEAAIEKYDEAIKLDKNYYDAWYEKSFSLSAMGKHKECISLSKEIIKKFPGNPGLKHVYVQWGSSLDDMGKPKDALDIFNEGIKAFPDEYLLFFNKGLTLQKLEKYEDALLTYQTSLKLKPLHSSSNLYTGLLLQSTNKIPALLAYATFLAIEPQTKRSAEAFNRVETILGANIKKEGNNTTIFLDPSMLNIDKNKKKENNFRSVEMLFSLMSAGGSKELDSLTKTQADKLSFKLQMLINSLADGEKENKGFYWHHYVPFFVAMKKDNHVGTLAHLMYMQTGDDANKKWLEENENAIQDFYDWVKLYKWKN